MATQIMQYEGVWEYDGSHMFRTFDGKMIWVKSHEDGVFVIVPTAGSTIQNTAKMAAECFEECSNFATAVGIHFEQEYSFHDLKGIRFDFNGVDVLVTHENANVKQIVQIYYDGMEALQVKHEQERAEYMKTPEYRAERAKALKLQTRKSAVEQLVAKAQETLEIEFKDDEARNEWEKFVEVNSKDGYSYGVVEYAERWAKFMQYLMEKHNKPVWQIADKASYVSDTEGITGFMYGCAVNVLSQVWKYGEDLRKWHNKQWGHDGDGVVNPAVLTISAG